MSNQAPNGEFPVFLTHVEANGLLLRIWAQVNADNASDRIEGAISVLTPEFHKGLGLPFPQSPELLQNVICCALYENDYYRARICDIDVANGSMLVQFIDYGNTTTVQPNQIRLLDGIPSAAHLARTPPLATDFILANVMPHGGIAWDEQVVARILNDLRYKTYEGQIVYSYGKYKFVRFLSNGQDVASSLTQQNLAVEAPLEYMLSRCNPQKDNFTGDNRIPLGTRNPLQTQNNHWRNDNVPTAPLAAMSLENSCRDNGQGSSDGAFRSRVLEIDSKHEVTISCVEDGPLMFSVQTSSTRDELSKLMYNLNFGHQPKPLSEPPVVGTACLGRYSMNKSLMRAVVTIVKECECKIHYVDFGQSEYLPYQDIYQLPRQYINPRILSTRFALSNVHELRINDRLKEFFRNHVEGKTLVLHVRPSPAEGGRLIQYADLYDGGHNVKELLRSKFGDALLSWPKAIRFRKYARAEVQVTHVDFPTIFVQVIEQTSSFDSVMVRINEYVQTAPMLHPNDIEKGTHCLACSNIDHRWLRAEILNVSGDAVAVRYVDFGHEEAVSTTSLRALFVSEITKVPAQAVRCTLNDCNKNMPNDLLNQLERDLMFRPFLLVVTDDGDQHVDLVDPRHDPPLNVVKFRLKQPQHWRNDRHAEPVNAGDPARFATDASRFQRNDRFSRPGEASVRRNEHQADFGRQTIHRDPPRPRSNNGSEKAPSDKDSDSSRGSGRSGFKGSSGSGSRRESGRNFNQVDVNANAERGGFKNARNSGVAATPRPRNDRRDFPDRNEMNQVNTFTSNVPDNPKDAAIPAPNITVGAVKNCALVFMISPTDFHVQLSPDNLELQPIMAKIAEIYESGGKIMDRRSMKEGVDCIAQYSEDNAWYRANIQSIEANGATVRFVDYGNFETVDFSKIKELDSDCAKLPAQAIACKLLAANKSTWDDEEGVKFANLTEEKRLEAEFIGCENNVFEILLRDVDAPSKKYVNEGFSGGADLERAKEEERSKGKRKTVDSKPSVDYAQPNEKWLVEDVASGTKHHVIVTWFVNPEHFYCHTLVKENEFRAMMNEMQQVYASRKPLNESLQVGSPVMAIFPDDGALYRAEILEANKTRGHVVRYIDFGNTATVDQRNMYKVERKFMKLPKQAFSCTLKNIVSGNGEIWPKAKKHEIEKCFESDDFECTVHDVKDGKLVVSLNNGSNDVAALLVEKSLASFAVPARVDIPEKVVTEPPIEPVVVKQLPKFDISLLSGQVLRVKVSNVTSAAKFHIQLPSAKESENLVDAYMAENNSQMLALPAQLSGMQNQAVECCLRNAKPDVAVDEKLRMKIQNKDVIVAIEEVSGNRLIVKLYDTNGAIIKLRSDEKDEKICPINPMPILYSTVSVGVSHLEHSSSVWLKKTSGYETDAELLTRLYNYYSQLGKDAKKLTESTPGTLCAALSFDGNWYRAKIVESTETDVLVHYIDHGNDERVPIENVRILDSQFMIEPELAIEVALNVTLGGTFDEQNEILNPLLLNNEFTATMYNIHGKWVAELTNENGKISETLAKFTKDIQKRDVPAAVLEMVAGERYKVVCPYAENPALFWLHMSDELAAIDDLQEKIQQAAETAATLDGIPEENTLCLAMYSVDETWYRAEVVDADGEIITVRFIDFGNYDSIYMSTGKCKEITDSLRSIKSYATKCRLDVIPHGAEDWTVPACAWFEEALTNAENMEAHVISADNSPKRVELFVDGKSIVEQLVERQFATKVHAAENLVEEIVERDVDPRAAYVSHAISANEFWMQQEKFVGDLEILADRLMVADMFLEPEEIKEGLLCVAKYPEDQCWYRARVIDNGDAGTKVIYIDYGNSAISTEIRAIPEDVAALPPYSKKCRLQLPASIKQWSPDHDSEFVKLAAEGATVFQLDVIDDKPDISTVRLTLNGMDIVERLAKIPQQETLIIDLGDPEYDELSIVNVRLLEKRESVKIVADRVISSQQEKFERAISVDSSGIETYEISDDSIKLDNSRSSGNSADSTVKPLANSSIAKSAIETISGNSEIERRPMENGKMREKRPVKVEIDLVREGEMIGETVRADVLESLEIQKASDISITGESEPNSPIEKAEIEPVREGEVIGETVAAHDLQSPETQKTSDISIAEESEPNSPIEKTEIEPLREGEVIGETVAAHVLQSPETQESSDISTAGDSEPNSPNEKTEIEPVREEKAIDEIVAMDDQEFLETVTSSDRLTAVESDLNSLTVKPNIGAVQDEELIEETVAADLGESLRAETSPDLPIPVESASNLTTAETESESVCEGQIEETVAAEVPKSTGIENSSDIAESESNASIEIEGSKSVQEGHAIDETVAVQESLKPETSSDLQITVEPNSLAVKMEPVEDREPITTAATITESPKKENSSDLNGDLQIAVETGSNPVIATIDIELIRDGELTEETVAANDPESCETEKTSAALHRPSA